MAFFKFRARGHKGDDPPASPAESIDDMRRRARHRLIGAAVLVAIGVLGFPLLFDTQPRPVQIDIPIEIPDRDKTRASAGRVAQAEPEAPARPAASAPPTVAPDASLGAREEVLADKPAPAPAKVAAEPKPEPRPEPRAQAKAEPRPDARPPAATDEGARARALLDGKSGATAAAAPAAAADQAGRFVVQVGAFADADKAREARQRLERAGLKTYTQEVETKEGKRIRVRVGPFAQRTDADKVVERIKGLSLPASVLSL